MFAIGISLGLFAFMIAAWALIKDQAGYWDNSKETDMARIEAQDLKVGDIIGIIINGRERVFIVQHVTPATDNNYEIDVHVTPRDDLIFTFYRHESVTLA